MSNRSDTTLYISNLCGKLGEEEAGDDGKRRRRRRRRRKKRKRDGNEGRMRGNRGWGGQR